MNFKLAFASAVAATIVLSGCGGGGGGGEGTSGGGGTAAAPAPSTTAATIYDAPALVKTDLELGAGEETASGKMITATYSLWLYDTTKSDFKGTAILANQKLTPVMLQNLLPLEGWVQGVPGMKVGGKRRLVLPSKLAYGALGNGKVPANSGVVFEIVLTDTSTLSDASALEINDSTVGTGVAALATSKVTVKYTLWLYDKMKANFRGVEILSDSPPSTLLSEFTGLKEGVPGMKVGGKRTVIVPASMAYGIEGKSVIPGNSGLVFEVELLAVN